MWDFVKALVMKAIVDALLSIGKTVMRGDPEEVEFLQIKERLQNGDLKIGDSVRLVGTYSEFLPFVNMSRIALLSRKSAVSPLPTCGPCKVQPLDDEHAGAILAEDADSIHRATPSLPVFFSHKYSQNSIRMLNFTSGDIIELSGTISPLPTIWKDIVVASDSFSFDRGDGQSYPFCLRVHNVEPYGVRLDRFNIDLWSLVHYEGKSLPEATPEELSLMEALIPDELFVESVLPGCFQLISPDVNILDQKETMRRRSILESTISKFPDRHLGLLRIIDYHGRHSVWKGKRQLRFVQDASFDNFALEPISRTLMTKKRFARVNRTHEVAFGHIPARQLYREFIGEPSKEFIDEARKYPRVLGDYFFLGSFLSEFRRYLDEHSEMPKNELEGIVLTIGSAKILGHYLRKYGRETKRRFTEEDINNLFWKALRPIPKAAVTALLIGGLFGGDLALESMGGEIHIRLLRDRKDSSVVSQRRSREASWNSSRRGRIPRAQG